jgi:hypothetical protein
MKYLLKSMQPPSEKKSSFPTKSLSKKDVQTFKSGKSGITNFSGKQYFKTIEILRVISSVIRVDVAASKKGICRFNKKLCLKGV